MAFCQNEDIQGCLLLLLPLQRLRSFEIIGWRHDGHVVDGAQYSEIMQAMVGCSQSAITHTGAYANKPYRIIGIGHVVFDLLQGPCC